MVLEDFVVVNRIGQNKKTFKLLRKDNQKEYCLKRKSVTSVTND